MCESQVFFMKIGGDVVYVQDSARMSTPPSAHTNHTQATTRSNPLAPSET